MRCEYVPASECRGKNDVSWNRATVNTENKLEHIHADMCAWSVNLESLLQYELPWPLNNWSWPNHLRMQNWWALFRSWKANIVVHPQNDEKMLVISHCDSHSLTIRWSSFKKCLYWRNVFSRGVQTKRTPTPANYNTALDNKRPSEWQIHTTGY